MIKMIAAVDRGNAIGHSDGTLPWRLQQDLKRFKELTLGSTVVMGRTTYLSLGRPDGLPGRSNIVLTRQAYSSVRSQFGNVDLISSLDYIKLRQKTNEVFWVIGGKSVYEEALTKNLVDEIHLTLVDATSGADVVLSADFASWKLWVLQQRKLGIHWESDLGTSQLDGNINTTYLTLYRL